MLIDSLVRYADQNSTVDYPMYESRPVHWRILLSSTGVPISMEWRDGARELRPFRSRGTGVYPILLTDKASYALGPGPLLDSTDQQDPQAQKEHQAFHSMLERLYGQVPTPELGSILAFLQGDTHAALQPSAVAADWTTRTKGAGDDQIVQFIVEGRNPALDKRVAQWWFDDCMSTAVSDQPVDCSVCGAQSPAMLNHLPVYARIPGSEVKDSPRLVSCNEAAYTHWGANVNNQVVRSAPVCVVCGYKYASTLSGLGQDDRSSHTWGDIRWIWWATDGPPINVASFLDADIASAEDIRVMVDEAMGGKEFGQLTAAHYYMVGLVGQKARITVVGWIDTSLDGIQSNLVRWLEGISIEGPWGEPSKPSPLWLLVAAAAPTHDRKKTHPTVRRITTQLIEAAILGRPLPLSVLSTIINHIKTQRAQGITREQASLLRYTLTQIGFDMSAPTPAYRCGEWLSVLADLQYSAQGKLNSTLTDRFYGSASTSPATVFPTLIRGSQAHLAKLRKQNSWLAFNYENKIGAIAEDLGNSFPRTLNLQQQGEFAIGYYRTQAQSRAEKTANSAKAKLAKATPVN